MSSVPNPGPRRILIVDDDPTLLALNRSVVGRAFPESTLETAMSAREGVSRLMAERFDLVLTDLQMPGDEDGRDVAACAREQEAACVMATSRPDLVDTSAVDDFLSKPYSAAELTDVLNGVLRRTRGVGVFEDTGMRAKAAENLV